MQVLDPATSIVRSCGQQHTVDSFILILENAAKIKRDVQACAQSTSNAIKAVLLGKEVANGVWMWRKRVLWSWQQFCEAANAELQDGVVIDLTVSA